MRDDQLVGTLRAIFRKVEEDLQSIDRRLSTIEALVTELKELVQEPSSEHVYEITLPLASDLLTSCTTTSPILEEDLQLNLDIDDTSDPDD